MMTQTLIFYLELAVAWWLFAWLYHDYRTDLLRYRLFLSRDRLFDFAEQGKISFDDPAYLLTRALINGSLRFAHRLTFTDVLITSIIQNKYNPNGALLYRKRVGQVLHPLNFEQKKLITDIQFDIHCAMISHIAHVAPFLFPIAYLVKMALKLHILGRRHMMTKKRREKLAPIDAVIYNLGNQSVAT